MMRGSGKLIALVVTSLVIYVALISAGQQYSAQQAAAGRTLYQTNCAGCHMADLGGRNEAPALAGPNFKNVWGTRPASELLNRIRTTMPPGRAGTLSADEYTNLTAFIVATNESSAPADASSGARGADRPASPR